MINMNNINIPVNNSRHMMNMNNTNAISLIELIATMVIVSILISVSYGTASGMKIEYRRKEAQNELIKLKANIEQIALSGKMSDGTSVISSIDVANKLAITTSATPIQTPNGYYSITVSNVLPNGATPGYTLTATPVATGPQARDTSCPSISLIILAGQDDIKNPDAGDPTKSCWK